MSAFLSPEDVRAIQMDLFHDASADYLRTGPYGDLEPRKVLQKIRNVKPQKVRRIIEAVHGFDGDSKESIRPSWSHYLAVAAGRHVWPDANHRTALLSFAQACERAFNLDVWLEPEVGEDLVQESKALRDPEFLRRGRYYSIKELVDENHPYRKLFRRYGPKIRIRPVDSE